MKPIIAILLGLFLFSSGAECASPGMIVQVSRKIRMRNSDPIPEKEYFVNLGRQSGIKEGDVLQVVRGVAVVDVLTAGELLYLRVVMGELRIFQVGESVSVGRIFTARAPDELPPLDDFDFVMGDEVRLVSAEPQAQTQIQPPSLLETKELERHP